MGTGYYSLTPPINPERFQHLVPVGQLPNRSVPVATRGLNYMISYDPIFKEFSESGIISCDPLYNRADCERVRPLKTDLEASIKKCDVPQRTPSFADPVYAHAFELTWQYLRDDLTVSLTPELCRDAEFNLSASAGFPYTLYGHRSKGDAFQTDMFQDLMNRFNYVPVDTVNSKDEFLSQEELSRHKLRTTFGAPLDKVAKQKFFFDAQNHNIINSSKNKWIQYGMTKQYGGFDRAIQRLEQFTHHIQSDAIGWDRNSFLGPVYMLRLRGLSVPDTVEELLNDTVFHTIYPTILLPDGSVWIRVTGNDSGGNNTASDNSILHLLIMMHLLTILYHEKYGEFPSLDDILENALMLIYSDDKLGGVNLEFFGVDMSGFASAEQLVYARYGMGVKPSSILVTTFNGRVDPRHEFLGSFLHFDERSFRYIPYPRIGKICSSVTRIGLNNDLSNTEYFMKTLQLTLLAYKDTEIFNILIHFIYFLIQRSNNDPELLQILEENNLSTFDGSTALSFHLGWESGPGRSFVEGTTVVSSSEVYFPFF